MQGSILHQPVKDNFVYNHQQKLVFLESSVHEYELKARRLDTRSILPFWNLKNASSSQRYRTLAELFNDCSSLSETPTWWDSRRNLWHLKPENEGSSFLSHSCCDVGNCHFLLFLIISFARESRRRSSSSAS